MAAPFEMMTLQYFRFHVALRSCPLQLHLLSSSPAITQSLGGIPLQELSHRYCAQRQHLLPPSQKPLRDGAWQKSAAIGKDFPP